MSEGISLSDKRQEINDGFNPIIFVYHEEDLKKSVKKLKKDCLTCGEKIIQGGRGRPNKSGICDKCRNDLLHGKGDARLVRIRKSWENKVDKIFGEKLI